MNPRKHLIITIGIIGLLFAGLIIAPGIGETPGVQQQELFEQANKHYSEKQYPEAVEKYNELLKQGTNTAHIHNNLATSYHRMGDTGKGILHFEKAAQLAPYNKDIKNNLAKARKDSTAYEASEPNTWQKIAHILSSKHWMILGSLSLLGFAIFSVLSLRKFIKPSRKLQAATSILAIGFIILAIFAVKTRQNHLQNKAIVLTKNTNLLVSPFPDASQVAVLQPGKTITIIPAKTHSNYTQVKLDTGKTGWLQADQIQPIK